MEEEPRVMNPWVAEILEKGGGTDDAVRRAQLMAREAFALSDTLKREIDRDFGSCFRNQLETLLSKERELDALRQRIFGGGVGRSGDKGNLVTILQRRMHEYISLASTLGRLEVSSEQRLRLEAYLDARRRQLYLGDAERVRTAISDFLLGRMSDVAVMACRAKKLIWNSLLLPRNPSLASGWD